MKFDHPQKGCMCEKHVAYREYCRKRQAQAYKDDPKRVLDRQFRYYHSSKHSEKIKAKNRKYYHANKERFTMYSAWWRKEHPERMAARQRRWRMKKKFLEKNKGRAWSLEGKCLRCEILLRSKFAGKHNGAFCEACIGIVSKT